MLPILNIQIIPTFYLHSYHIPYSLTLYLDCLLSLVLAGDEFQIKLHILVVDFNSPFSQIMIDYNYFYWIYIAEMILIFRIQRGEVKWWMSFTFVPHCFSCSVSAFASFLYAEEKFKGFIVSCLKHICHSYTFIYIFHLHIFLSFAFHHFDSHHN